LNCGRLRRPFLVGFQSELVRQRLIQSWTFDVQCSKFGFSSATFQAIEIGIAIGIEIEKRGHGPAWRTISIPIPISIWR